MEIDGQMDAMRKGGREEGSKVGGTGGKRGYEGEGGRIYPRDEDKAQGQLGSLACV